LAKQVKPVPLVYCSALVDVEQLGIANAVGDALAAVAFASTVFAACDASEPGAIKPGAVNVPVTVSPAMVGAVASTTLPDPVDAVAPVPPDATGSGDVRPEIVPPVMAVPDIVPPLMVAFVIEPPVIAAAELLVFAANAALS
jgi:hypothetical protein